MKIFLNHFRNTFVKIAILLGVFYLLWVSPSNLNNNFSIEAKDKSNPYISSPVLAATTSRFTFEVNTKIETLPFKTEYKDDPESEIGLLTVSQEGKNGKKEQDIKTTFYDGKKYASEIIDTRITQPTPKIITKGTKIIIREIETIDGKISYKGKITALASAYNETCHGCNFWTATGRMVKRGIVAVDPKVIPLHSKLYIPGYGFAEAEDVGGAIKGNKIDLYFENEQAIRWGIRWVDVYLLN